MVKVLDFGLAKAMEPASGTSANAMNSPTLSIHATQAGIILGTAAYMSPEQAAGKAVDKRSDLWAFGVVVLEMLTGRPVFTGETVSHVLASVLKTDPDWNTLPVSTPPPIRRLLRRCLEKDRKRRLADAADARLEIDEALTAPTGDADMVDVTTPRAAWARALPWGIAVAALAMLAAVVVSFAYLRQNRPAGALVRFTVAPPFGATRAAGQAFAVSPDGQTIAFRANGANGMGRLFTRRIDQADAQPVAGTDNATLPFWSPDSRSLGFSKEGGLYRTDLDDSAPRPRRRQARGVIWAVSIDDPTRTLVAESSGGAAYADGWLLTTTAGTRGLVAQPFDPERLTLGGAPQPVRDRLWFATSGGASGFSVSLHGALAVDRPTPIIHQLTWMDRAGRVVGTLGPAAVIGEFGLAPDERRVAANVTDIASLKNDLWLFDTQREEGTRLTFQVGHE